MTTYKTLGHIRANVTARWNHKNCKFQPGDHAEVSAQVLPREWVHQDECGGRRIRAGHSYVSHKKQQRVAQVGRVVAVSCLKNGHIRSGDDHWTRGLPSRMYTRYYIRFKDGEIMGFDSHHLNRAFGS